MKVYVLSEQEDYGWDSVIWNVVKVITDKFAAEEWEKLDWNNRRFEEFELNAE